MSLQGYTHPPPNSPFAGHGPMPCPECNELVDRREVYAHNMCRKCFGFGDEGKAVWLRDELVNR